MKYNEFESMIVPFINVRWWDVVYPYASLQVAIQNAIQDIYNEYRWSWLITSKKIINTDWIDWNWYYLYDIGNMKWIQSIIVSLSNSNIQWPLTEVENITELSNYTFIVSGNFIIVSEKVTCTVTYFKDYTWNLFSTDTTTEIPFPDKMIPALYYLVLSQIDIIEVTQASSQTYSNYWKYSNKIKKLIEQDAPLNAKLQWWAVN